MKKILTIIAGACIILAACNKEEQGVKINPVYFESFGFSVEENADYLSKDVIVKDLKTTNRIDVVLPAVTYVENLKNLCPRFELAEGIVVTVADTLVESGKDTMDFSSPVEFLLTKTTETGSDYFSYTVNVSIESNNWAKVATAPDSLKNGVSVAYDSANDAFYVLGTRYHKASADQIANYPMLLKFNGREFAYGTAAGEDREAGVLYNTQCEVRQVAVCGNAVYSVFEDYSANTSRYLTVVKAENNIPSLVGERGVIYRPLNSVCLAPFAENNIWVASGVNAKSGNIARRALNVALYNGTTWANEQSCANRQETNAYFPKLKMTGSNAYMTIENQKSHTFSIYKCDGSTWTAIEEKVQPITADGVLPAKLSFYYDFDITESGDIYLLAQVPQVDENYRLTLLKYDPEKENKFTVIGSTIPSMVTTNGSVVPSMAISPSGVPYVAFANNVTGNGRIYVTHIDDATKDWTNPEPVTDGPVMDDVILSFNKAGKPFVFCTPREGVVSKSVLEVYSTK